jgi:hypothetical protein
MRRKPEARQRAGQVLYRPAVIRWKRPIEKILVFLERINKDGSVHGDKWVIRMREHYGERITALFATAPPGAEQALEQVRLRLDRALKR